MHLLYNMSFSCDRRISPTLRRRPRHSRTEKKKKRKEKRTRLAFHLRRTLPLESLLRGFIRTFLGLFFFFSFHSRLVSFINLRWAFASINLSSIIQSVWSCVALVLESYYSNIDLQYSTASISMAVTSISCLCTLAMVFLASFTSAEPHRSRRPSPPKLDLSKFSVPLSNGTYFLSLADFGIQWFSNHCSTNSPCSDLIATNC